MTTMAENVEENASAVPEEAQPETSFEDTSEQETKEETTTEETTTKELPARPIKRARTAYFIFADDKRSEIAAQHPGEGVGAVAKVISKLWSSLGDEDKAVYQRQAAEERVRVSKLVEQYKDAMPDQTMDNAATKANPLLLQLPAARIRKICKLDPEVKGLSKEALQLITKCAECMTVKLGMETRKVAQLQNRRTILPDDVAHVCANREPFFFLKEDIRDLQKQLITNKVDRRQGKLTTSHITTTTKPLSDYFHPPT